MAKALIKKDKKYYIQYIKVIYTPFYVSMFFCGL